MSERRTELVQLGRALRERGYTFTTVTPATHARVLAHPVTTKHVTLRDIFGWNRPFHEADLGAELLRCMREAGVLSECNGQLRSTVRFSTVGGEAYFHSGFPTSGHDAVFLGPDTYRFVRALNQAAGSGHSKVRRAVDVGCGTGAAAVALARHYPEAEIIAADINARALEYAAVNVQLAGTKAVQVRHSDLLTQLDGEFDLIMANPPYLLDPGERAYRHGGGELGAGLALRIVRAAIERLADGGSLWLYTGAAVVDGVCPFQRDAGAVLDAAAMRWTCDEIDPDVFGEELDTPAYAGVERIAALWLCARKESH